METTIYHNPACGTSRNTLALIREAGIEPTVVEYLKTPLDTGELRALAARGNLSPRDLLRQKEPLAAELGLTDPGADDAQILTAIAAHPILLNRPVVANASGVRVCRPADTVREILPNVRSRPGELRGGAVDAFHGVRLAIA